MKPQMVPNNQDLSHSSEAEARRKLPMLSINPKQILQQITNSVSDSDLVHQLYLDK
jgi:hypothetical protein